MTNHIEVLREMRDSWAELGSKAYDKYVAACDAAIRALSPAGGDPERGKNDPSWTLHDRVEFALRDAGFDYDEAFRIAMLAASPQQEPEPPHWGNLPDGFDDPELYPPTPADESGPAINSAETYSKPIADPSGQTLAGAGPTTCECGEPERGGHAVWCPMRTPTATSAGNDSEDAARFRFWLSAIFNGEHDGMFDQLETSETPEQYVAAIDAARRAREVG